MARGTLGCMRFTLYYVYIMASRSRVLYIGVTNDPDRRVAQHRSCADADAFCTRYRVFDLVTSRSIRPLGRRLTERHN